MRLRRITTAAVFSACLAGGALAAPPLEGAGVVAKVAGGPITLDDLRAERQSLGPTEASDDPALLQRIIMRRLLVQKAREAGLDKAPDYDAHARRAAEVALAQQYERNIAVASAQPTSAEIQAFMASRPEMFTRRRIAIMNQVVARPADSAPKRFKDLKTLEAVKAFLVAENTPFEEGWAVLDTLTADPAIALAISKLREGEVFAIPTGRAMVFNSIMTQRQAPLGSGLAAIYATTLLQEQRKREALDREFRAIRSAGEPLITYAADYKPPGTARR